MRDSLTLGVIVVLLALGGYILQPARRQVANILYILAGVLMIYLLGALTWDYWT